MDDKTSLIRWVSPSLVPLKSEETSSSSYIRLPPIDKSINRIQMQGLIIELLLDILKHDFRLLSRVVQYSRVESHRMRLDCLRHMSALKAAELFELRVTGPRANGNLNIQ
jgi:hypothetical protein